MTVEHARAHAVAKPWGIVDCVLGAMHSLTVRSAKSGTSDLKGRRRRFRFCLNCCSRTSLSIQVHPDDGPIGIVGLVAYTGGGPVPHLLQHVKQPDAMNAVRPQEVEVPLLTPAKATPINGRLEITQ